MPNLGPKYSEFYVRASSFGDNLAAAVAAVERMGGGCVTLGLGRSYALGSRLDIPLGVRLEGASAGAGYLAPATIVGHMTSGPVVRLAARGSGLANVKVDASAARQAGSGNGVEIYRVGQTVTTGRVILENVWVINQPGDAFHFVAAELALGRFLTADTCDGFGFFMDDGTADGEAIKPGGSWNSLYENCRAISCGRAGLSLDSPSVINTFINFQALGCDTTETDGYQALVKGASQIFINPDIEDQQFAANKAVPSIGMDIQGRYHQILGGHFSSLTRTLDLRSARSVKVQTPRIFAGAYGVAQASAFVLDINCVNCHISADNATGFGAANVTAVVSDAGTGTVVDNA